MASTRRSVLAALIASPVLAMADSDLSAAAPTFGVDLTPDCHDGDEHTVAQTEGPYLQAQCTSEARPCGRCAERRTDDNWRTRARYCLPAGAKDTGTNLACRRVRGL